jgi:excinuclease UvrABC ATPase subunit
MSETVRCIACRGSKKVAKLGGMIGDCNLCKGTGRMNDCDRPKPQVIPVDDSQSIASEVAKAVPVSKSEIQEEVKGVAEAIKVDRKRAIYKRKKA